MNCIHCGYPTTKVIYTLTNDIKNFIQRRRACVKCNKRFTTDEKLRDIKKVINGEGIYSGKT